MRIVAILVLVVVLAVGCAHMMQPKIIELGMTQEQVVQQWGRPWNRAASVGPEGVIEVWQYGHGPYESKRFLTFKNGILHRITKL